MKYNTAESIHIVIQHNGRNCAIEVLSKIVLTGNDYNCLKIQFEKIGRRYLIIIKIE